MSAHLSLIRFALGSLERRAPRSLALVVGLSFAVALFGAVWMLGASLRAELSAMASAAPDLTVQQLRSGRPALLPIEAARPLGALPAVRSVTPRVWGYAYLGVLDANLTIVGAAPGTSDLGRTQAVQRAPGAPAAPSGDVMWMGRALTELLGLTLGDKFALPGRSGPVVLTLGAVFDDASALRTADLVLVDLPTARELLDVPDDRATDFAVSLSQPLEAPLVAAKIRSALPGRSRVLEKTQLERAYGQSFGARSGLMMAGLLPALAALLLIAFDRLSGLSEEERREIGILRASGFLTADILTVRLWESLLLSVTSAMAGLIGAYVFVFVLGAPMLREVLFGYSTLYPPLHLTPQLDVREALAVITLVCVPFSAVSIVPAWRAAVLDPGATLRGAE